MNQTRDPNEDDLSLEGFEAPEHEFDVSSEDDMAVDSDASDAEFQDVGLDDNGQELDADVFGEAPQEEPVNKKKVNWFNIGVAAVATLLAGGLVWSKLGPQFSGGGVDQNPVAVESPAAISNPQMSSEAAAQAALAGGGPIEAGANLLENPDQLAQLGQSAAPVVAQPDTATPSEDPFAALAVMPSPSANEQVGATSLPMPAPIAPSSEGGASAAVVPVEQASVDVVDRVPPSLVPAPQLVTGESPAVDSSAEVKAQVAALEGKLQSLDSKIDAAIAQMASFAGQSSASPAVDDAKLSRIESALERLEARIDTLSSKQTEVVRSVSQTTQPAVKKAKKVSASTKSSSKASSKWDEPYQSASVSKPQKASSGNGGWALRGARTGHAVVAKGADLREIAVGDSLPGLGEITGIATVGGRWVVQGTEGRLSQ